MHLLLRDLLQNILQRIRKQLYVLIQGREQFVRCPVRLK